ncbi:MAG: hypothetical protein G3M78_08165 [Candidatus Nitrohelix vancouverensis]|uniref:Secreted protein n=1 Tax=Candidatus Nitrohelix vancouverensis TaxID=2705534 RepID=A0A7T0C2N4_9BACT|nr:MAG: hypothetical protein G3M78_08165 [Candidatus Nitrohelix vancouverensis]
MNKVISALGVMFLAGFISLPQAGAEEVADVSMCTAITNPLEKNLCLALHPIKNPQNRYQHKDHSIYYCSLMQYQKDRDMMNFCTAVVQSDPGMCSNIGDTKLEKICVSCSEKDKELGKECLNPRQ